MVRVIAYGLIFAGFIWLFWAIAYVTSVLPVAYSPPTVQVLYAFHHGTYEQRLRERSMEEITGGESLPDSPAMRWGLAYPDFIFSVLVAILGFALRSRSRGVRKTLTDRWPERW